MFATDAQLHRHEELWFRDGTIVLQAEQTTFKVHASLLELQSEFFKDMMSLPQDAQRQDGTEASPLVVSDVTADGLSVILRIIYHVWGTQLDLDNDAFISALRTAHRLQFPAIIKSAVSTLNTRLTAAEKLRLGMECDIDEWQQPAFEDLVLGFLDVPPVSHLGETICAKVYSARARVVEARVAWILKTRSVCTHQISALLCAVPSVPRSQLQDRCSSYHSRFRDPKCCDKMGPVSALMLPEATEREIAAALWNGTAPPVVHWQPQYIPRRGSLPEWSG